MLKVEWISEVKVEKDTPVYRNAWKAAKLGKFSSSRIHTLCNPKGLGSGAMTYIYEKLMEEFTGIPAKYEIDNEYTRWGLINEADGIKQLGAALGVEMLVTQCLIHQPGSRFASTPDAIWAKKKYADAWDVETGEVKCYPSERFIKCVLCETAKDVFEADPDAYWQVLDQMDNCEAMNGNLVYYHPDMKAAKFKLIKFRKMELLPDFATLKTRKQMASTKFDELRSKLLNIV
jgi:hypothetical protein